ncbi:SPOR domain-containing protein [Flaviaesturariibacter aridisoli]|uniref:SPOR domain-containing protein n=1 Tax=Flaviaesturariibacter aridisoli TaxID=2545761 RepID=A0A4R4DWP5_9BACT|nr:SPOR domain-containing protein [Flaviaesturariibacter aridisoli]TCZ68571.1 SPOR domain-containing protein [Flaviaesturariibacter aridisoli]
MKYLALLLTLFTFSAASAQSSVVVHKDPRVDLLAKRQGQINVAVRKASSRTAQGFRLLIISTTDRQAAIDAKSKIYTLYPELKAYLSYQSPYYKLKAGNFKTRAEADSYRKSLNAQFPKGVFVINDVVELKAEKETVEIED